MSSSALLFLALFSVSSASAQGGGFVFPGQTAPRRGDGNNDCKPITECRALLDILDSNPGGLSEFETCGFEGETPLYKCPNLNADAESSNERECDCRSIRDCPQLDELAKRRDFKALKRQTICGYEKSMVTPRFCCPFVPPIKRVGSNRPKPVRTRINMDSVDVAATIDEEATQCGFSNGLKIFGGEDAGDHEYPWAAALVYVDAKKAAHGDEAGSRLFLCGGTLVGPQHVLTAAHCINSRGGHHLSKVRLGHANLSHPDGFDVDIESVTLHPEFETQPLLVNDLALLKLVEPVETGSKVRPVCLPKYSDFDDEAEEEEEIVEPVVVGWGLVDAANSSEVLQKLELEITSNQICEAIYQTKIEGLLIEDSQLCASGSRGADSCKGDSGGPLMYLDDDSRYRIVGVTSFGTVKCDSSVPGVYTRVAYFRDWVESVILAG